VAALPTRSPPTRCDTTRVLWACFLVGFNNFGTGRGATAALKSEISNELQAVGGAVIGSFGSTGNFVIETHGRTDSTALRHVLEVASGGPCAVVKWPAFKRALAALDQLPTPVRQRGMRWTPGLAFAIVAPERLPSLAPTPRGRFTILRSRTVAIFKYDVEDSRGRLDSARRKGGWGALSNDISRQVGGVWTSRARSGLRGLATVELTRRAASLRTQGPC